MYNIVSLFLNILKANMLENLSWALAPSYNSLSDVFVYVPEAGALCRRVRRNGVLQLAIAGSPTTSGRIQVREWGITHRAEALIWALAYREWPSNCPEHRDKDLSNNLLENLYLPTGTTTHPLPGA